MVSDLLDHGLVEVTSVALETIANLEGVLHALENALGGDGALSQVKASLLAIGVDVLDPSVVIISRGIIDVILKLDDV